MLLYENNINVFYVYFQIIKKYNDYMEEALEKYNFTPGEIAVLTFLANNPKRKTTASDISLYRALSKGLISRAVHSLLDKKLIVTEENPDDGRSVYLEISDTEDELLKELQYFGKTFKDKLVDHIVKEDLETFNKVNGMILNNLKNNY